MCVCVFFLWRSLLIYLVLSVCFLFQSLLNIESYLSVSSGCWLIFSILSASLLRSLMPVASAWRYIVTISFPFKKVVSYTQLTPSYSRFDLLWHLFTLSSYLLTICYMGKKKPPTKKNPKQQQQSLLSRNF